MLFIALSLLLMPRYGCDKFPSALPWVSLCDPSLPHETLLVRAREISSAYNSAISDNFLTSYGPNLMLGIITFGTKNIFDYAAYSFAINAAFAQYNNYYFRFIEEGEFNNGERIDDVRWSKVKILLEALDPNSGWARDFDYLVWIDSDLVFLDFKLRLELVADLQRADIVASAGILTLHL